jgi:hypothetical protein
VSGWLSDWCQIGSGPYIGWGIFFVREDSDEWSEYEPPISVFEGAYVNIDFPSPVEPPKEGGFEHWHFPTWKHEKGEDFEVYNLVSLNDLEGDFTTAFSTWVADHFDEAHGCWLNGPGGKTPSREEIALLGRAKLKQAAQEYFETWFTSYGKSPSSSSTSCTYDKLFG